MCETCVFLCVPWPNWRHGFWRFESGSSGSHYCWVFILVHFVICPLPCLSTFCVILLCCLDLSLPDKSEQFCGRAAHTTSASQAFSITMTASPASLTGLLNSSYTGWMCSGFLLSLELIGSGSTWMEGRVQMRACKGSCGLALVPQLPCCCCYSNRAELGTALAPLHPLQTLQSVHRMVNEEKKVIQEESRRVLWETGVLNLPRVSEKKRVFVIS